MDRGADLSYNMRRAFVSAPILGERVIRFWLPFSSVLGRRLLEKGTQPSRRRPLSPPREPFRRRSNRKLRRRDFVFDGAASPP